VIKPEWLRVKLPTGAATVRVEDVLRRHRLTTVCYNAVCPNRAECYQHAHLTFLILGTICTRYCRYCGVSAGVPARPDAEEPTRIVDAISDLRLREIVITSVTRDDLSDYGAGHWASVIAAVRQNDPAVEIEVLLPDFGGDEELLAQALMTLPDIVGHNLETVRRCFAVARPGADYDRSLAIISKIQRLTGKVKSGLMLGLGESCEEIIATLGELYRAGCRHITLGQYLQPSVDRLPVHRFVRPEEFVELRHQALAMGFTEVVAGPLVRSSYRNFA